MEKKKREKELLRLITAGSVDDGKSTLIGRLLYDAEALPSDQLEWAKKKARQKGKQTPDLASFTDGLRAEREQGITIDVAYRYFGTPKRNFILADTPGHIEYTRNMITGASTANLALLLIDARNGILEQTKRHAFIASLLHLPHIVVCINKMDLVDYNEDVFEEIVAQYEDFSSKMVTKDIRYIPISALKGDNVFRKSEAMPWYQGRTLLDTLETLHISSDQNLIDGRFPIQTVIRPQTEEHPDFRAYAGSIASGIFRKNDKVIVLPSGTETHIKAIYQQENEIEEAFPPMAVSLTLTDQVDLSRGNMLAKQNNQPTVTNAFDGMLCWLQNKPLRLNQKYQLVHTTQQVQARIQSIHYKIDIDTLERIDSQEINANDIAKVRIQTSLPLFIDKYRENRATGSLILIDATTHETVAAVMIT